MDSELPANLCEIVASEALNDAVVEDPERTRDLAGTRDIDSRPSVGANYDVALNGLAASELGGISLAVDGSCSSTCGASSTLGYNE